MGNGTLAAEIFLVPVSKFEVWEEGSKKEPEGDDESQNHRTRDGAGVGGKVCPAHLLCARHCVGTGDTARTRIRPYLLKLHLN